MAVPPPTPQKMLPNMMPDHARDKTPSFFDDAMDCMITADKSDARRSADLDNSNNPGQWREPLPNPVTPANPQAWEQHASSGEEQFLWMRSRCSIFTGPPPKLNYSKGTVELGCAPVPPGKSSVQGPDTIEYSSSMRQKNLYFLAAEPAPRTPTSADPAQMPCFRRPGVDDELLPNAPEESDNPSPIDTPCPPPRKLGRTPSAVPDSPLARQPIKRRQHAQSNSASDLLPSIHDADVAASLIAHSTGSHSNKKPRMQGESHLPSRGAKADPATDTFGNTPPSTDQGRQSPTLTEGTASAAAMAPNAAASYRKGFAIVSLGISRALSKNLDAYWAADRLVYRDYTRHNEVSWCNETGERVEIQSPLSLEADVTLTPTVGVVITTLAQAKEQPISWSNVLPQIRRRVVGVSKRYESLIVLVSAANTSGEHMTTESDDDIAGYADFAQFNASLPDDVTTYLVPGNVETMTKWILTLLHLHTTQTVVLSELMEPTETTWEVFFRRTGMNTMAAQVLAGALYKQEGSGGLARFASMSPQQRVSGYSGLLGGEKLIRLCGCVLDSYWS